MFCLTNKHSFISFLYFIVFTSFFSLTSKWRGDSEKLVRILFELAHFNAPSIIFIDEIEAILSDRGAPGEHEASKRMKAEFLIHLDGLKSENQDNKVLFLASTNLPWTLDPAILRRFQKIMPVDLPLASDKLEIFKQCLKGYNTNDLDLKSLVNANTQDFSGKCL